MNPVSPQTAALGGLFESDYGKISLDFNYVYVCDCVHGVHAMPWEATRGRWIVWNWIYRWLLVAMWVLQEQPVLLPAELALQTLVVLFFLVNLHYENSLTRTHTAHLIDQLASSAQGVRLLSEASRKTGLHVWF